ncbi:DUF6199 family natural product biosynthesis protein [Streptomyces sp. CA-294286]|uniref:DUF6199 family natural product biosynthesis protein n=1 Tax=Streptomyces sp. CA-294286 TaxID=3240070 RepID=UPI003D8E94ED
MGERTVGDVVMAANDGSPPVVTWVIMTFLLAMGLTQTFRPQLLWRMNRSLQRPFVQNADASEPNRAGYALQRAIGVFFLGMWGYMLFVVLT